MTLASTHTDSPKNGASTSRKPAPHLEITKARLEDMQHVARIVSSTAEWYRPILDEKDMAEHAVDEKWARKNFSIREFFIGRVRGEVVGIASMQHAGDYVYVGYVYVSENMVGNGFGRKLLAHVDSIARGRHYKGLVLIAHPEASWAVRAYEKYGFKVVETDREKILGWNESYLKPYYEEGFVLFRYDF